MARALGWPKRAIGFSDVLRLAQADRGWEQFGHPEFGAFKLVHTNPDYSTSGLSGVVAEYYSATAKKEGLTEADVDRARRSVKSIESAIVHYGDTTLFIADQLRREGPGYASAVFMEEATLVDFNQRRGGQDKLVGIYPAEGTFYSDSPYIVLDAPWVSAEQRAAAERFAAYLDEQITPATAGRYGFRPGALDQRPAGALTAANGADPAQPRRVLGVPEPRVLAKIKDTWRADRKPANVLLVLDTSGSMVEGKRLVNAKRGLQAFLREAAPQDRIGLTAFSDEIRDLVPVREMSANREPLRQTVTGLVADGGTAAYDAVEHAVTRIRGTADSDHINAVVVLTDGEDTDSSLDPDDLRELLERQGDSASRVRVFTIAYGNSVAGAKEADGRDRGGVGRARLRGRHRRHRRRLPLDLELLLMSRPTPPPDRRQQYLSALLLNAAAKPFNVLVLLVVAAAGILVGAPVALAVGLAAVLYALGVSRTVLDEGEQDKVLGRLRGDRARAAVAQRAKVRPEQFAPAVRRHLDQAIATQQRIADAIDRAQLPYEALAGEVDAFVTMMNASAERAQMLYDGLSENPPEAIEQRLRELQGSGKSELIESLEHQLHVMRTMERQLQRQYDVMERVVVELDTVRGSLLSVSASDDSANQEILAGEVRQLRDRMRAVADGLDEASQLYDR